MTDISLSTIVFYLLAGLTLGGAAGVAFFRNIVYTAVSLFLALSGVAALYFYLGADFLGVVQLLVYVGGVVVLTIFAVFLTHRIDVNVTNRSAGWLPSIAICLAVLVLLGRAVWTTSWQRRVGGDPQPTTYAIGDLFLRDYVLPFELASLVLLAAVIGAIVLSRKEVRD